MLNQRLVPNSMEPRGVVAHYEPGKGTMTIWSSTQNPHILRTFIAALTGLGQDQVRAIAPEVGGGFGAKINIYGEEYVAAAISKRLGVPVKWAEDRSEAFVAIWIEFARSMAPMMMPAAHVIAELVAGTGDLKVLDIAAGHGLFGITIAQRNPRAEIVAVDWPPVLAVATEHARAAGVQDRHRTLPGDAL